MGSSLASTPTRLSSRISVLDDWDLVSIASPNASIALRLLCLVRHDPLLFVLV